MGLIDGTTRDECLALEALMKTYAANGQWLQAWVVSSHHNTDLFIGSKLHVIALSFMIYLDPNQNVKS